MRSAKFASNRQQNGQDAKLYLACKENDIHCCGSGYANSRLLRVGILIVCCDIGTIWFKVLLVSGRLVRLFQLHRVLCHLVVGRVGFMGSTSYRCRAVF